VGATLSQEPECPTNLILGSAISEEISPKTFFSQNSTAGSDGGNTERREPFMLVGGNGTEREGRLLCVDVAGAYLQAHGRRGGVDRGAEELHRGEHDPNKKPT